MVKRHIAENPANIKQTIKQRRNTYVSVGVDGIITYSSFLKTHAKGLAKQKTQLVTFFRCFLIFFCKFCDFNFFKLCDFEQKSQFCDPKAYLHTSPPSHSRQLSPSQAYGSADSLLWAVSLRQKTSFRSFLSCYKREQTVIYAKIHRLKSRGF